MEAEAARLRAELEATKNQHQRMAQGNAPVMEQFVPPVVQPH